MQDSLSSLSYDYIVDQQPIAAKLFRQFCAKHKNTTLQHYNDFLDAVESYELELEEGRVKTAQSIVTKYLTRPATSDSGVDTCEESQGRIQIHNSQPILKLPMHLPFLTMMQCDFYLQET